MEARVKVESLVKSYGPKRVLKGISFEVGKGEIFGLLGANGAGKTTTLECIEGLRTYDGGSITLRGSLGVQLQSSSLPPYIKPFEALELFARWQGGAADISLAERLGLQEFKGTVYRALSTGQKRKLHLALALHGDPEVIILDEPTAGLDVAGRAALHGEIRRLRRAGKTLVLASHDMAEVEQLCDRIAVLKDGLLAFVGTAAELSAVYNPAHRLHLRFSSTLGSQEFFHAAYQGEEQGYSVYEVTDLTQGLLELLQAAEARSLRLIDMTAKRASLEASFLRMAGEEELV